MEPAAISHTPGPTPQRTRGEAAVSLVARGGRTVLKGLRQRGSAKAILLHSRDSDPEVVFLNTAGGLTGGDRLSYVLDLAPGCRAVATTQTAERLYRASEGQARIAVTMTLGAGARLDWLPQETILFDGCAAARRTDITLGEGAECLALEAGILGRAAMGERLGRFAFRDTRLIRRGARPLSLEPLALDGAALAAGPAVLGGARAYAGLVLVARGAEDAAGPVRAVLDEPGVQGGASGFDGRLVVRLMAGDGWPLRRQIARLLAALGRAPLPRVWQMQESMA